MLDIKEYQSELGEKAIKIILERWFALSLEKIPEIPGIKTPDYKFVDSAGNIIAIGEVKSCVAANIETFDPALSFEAISEASKKRDKNHRSKIENHHGKAILQLPEDSNIPTVIIFMSFDGTDWIDMAQYLQNYKKLYPSSPMSDLYLLIKVHQSIIPSNSFEVNTTPRLMYTTELGKDFGEHRLSLKEALQNGGKLPAIFNLENSDLD